MEALKNQVSEVFALQREYFLNHLKSAPLSVRKYKLKKLKKWILAHENEICSAIHADFKKPYFETRISEIFPTVSAIRHALQNMDNWASADYAEGGLGYLFTSSKIRKEPKGVVLVISPWNYPFMLALEPAISAIAAGCTVMLKPSENTPHTSELLKKMAEEVFKPEELTVFLGDYTVSQELLKKSFNHLFFTGSPQVGKIVMKAAAEHLTSVTLELGGMNPAVLDETADLKDAAEKILWAKGMNSAQTCVSVNEMYVHESVKDKLVDALHKAEKKLYPRGYEQGEDMSVLVNEQHFSKVKEMVTEALDKGAKTLLGGEMDDANRWISPTVMADVPKECKLRNEEIFAPVVVLTAYSDLDQVISDLQEKPVPLSAYIFSKSRKNQKKFLAGIQAGTTCVNDTTIQFAQPNLPFGGHGNSGIGKAHGKFGFLEFTNQRAELRQRRGFTSAKLIYPPYDKKWKQLIVKTFIKWL
ncbi:MAG TPA: aldehyde dehydrogenase family protein [Flavobacteriales bacterium]|nr:aldehyde dehydrogenase family protein [Flavobacteriales bacterium]